MGSSLRISQREKPSKNLSNPFSSAVKNSCETKRESRPVLSCPLSSRAGTTRLSPKCTARTSLAEGGEGAMGGNGGRGGQYNPLRIEEFENRSHPSKPHDYRLKPQRMSSLTASCRHARVADRQCCQNLQPALNSRKSESLSSILIRTTLLRSSGSRDHRSFTQNYLRVFAFETAMCIRQHCR